MGYREAGLIDKVRNLEAKLEKAETELECSSTRSASQALQQSQCVPPQAPQQQPEDGFFDGQIQAPQDGFQSEGWSEMTAEGQGGFQGGLIFAKREQLSCSNPRCNFAVHSDPKVCESHCCKKCRDSPEDRDPAHGQLCERVVVTRPKGGHSSVKVANGAHCAKSLTGGSYAWPPPPPPKAKAPEFDSPTKSVGAASSGTTAELTAEAGSAASGSGSASSSSQPRTQALAPPAQSSPHAPAKDDPWHSFKGASGWNQGGAHWVARKDAGKSRDVW